MEPQLRKRRRHLPHWQLGGSVYFITFRSARGALPPPAMKQVIDNILFDHGRRYDLHLGVVMPDHAHVLLQPLQVRACTWHELPAIMKSLKGASARRINQLLGTRGTVWQEEYFDRIVRDAQEYDEKANYIWNNPVNAGLVANADDWE